MFHLFLCLPALYFFPPIPPFLSFPVQYMIAASQPYISFLLSPHFFASLGQFFSHLFRSQPNISLLAQLYVLSISLFHTNISLLPALYSAHYFQDTGCISKYGNAHFFQIRNGNKIAENSGEKGGSCSLLLMMRMSKKWKKSMIHHPMSCQEGGHMTNFPKW